MANSGFENSSYRSRVPDTVESIDALAVLSQQRLVLILRQFALVSRVIHLNLAAHATLPSIDEGPGIVGVKMSTERRLIRPPFRNEQAPGLRVGHCSVVGNVSGTLPRGDRKPLKINEKLRKIRGIDVHISGYYEHGGSILGSGLGLARPPT